MTSTNPHHIIDDDDDDDFDWEAAARAIDVVYQTQASKPSTSLPDQSSHFAPPPNNPPIQNSVASISENMKKPGSSRQTTLDQFIGRACPRPQPESRDVQEHNRDCNEGDGRVSSVQIDTEAAKTWMYPG